jgi:hypothetical protein
MSGGRWLNKRRRRRNNIKKSAVSRRKYQQEYTGQMPSKFGEIIKKLISVFGEKLPEGYPSHPPPHSVKIPRILHVEKTRY